MFVRVGVFACGCLHMCAFTCVLSHACMSVCLSLLGKGCSDYVGCVSFHGERII